jgi:hypothetical protein
MALTYNQISAITERKFLPKMVDNIFDSNPLMQRWKKGEQYESIDGGTSILQPLNYATNSAGGWYSGADTLSTTDNDVITSAEYNWVQMYDNISILRSDELKNSGDAAILKFVKQKMKIAEQTGIDRMGTGLYNSGTDAKAIVGLRAMLSTSGTIGGISQTTYSWWQAQVDGSTTTLSIAAMAGRMSAARVGSDRPTVITSNSDNWDRYHALLQPQQRFQDAESAKGGFSSLMFQGIPLIDDSHCPTGYMFFLNEKYLALYYHKDENFRFEEFQKPVNQNVKVAKIYWMGAFGASNNRMQAALTAITA